jgi:hypothetical protein
MDQATFKAEEVFPPVPVLEVHSSTPKGLPVQLHPMMEVCPVGHCRIFASVLGAVVLAGQPQVPLEKPGSWQDDPLEPEHHTQHLASKPDTGSVRLFKGGIGPKLTH